ncbi:unnamed protein product [Clonostachys byssicola]|uniref:Uncharacterized protein n=1 Tax=Clonostachys byssicola TaxID=160290 RepID=A0A9N9Y7I1_9HYPO|nr:unnamed protein product [Clonostachys byssicola]
MASPANNHPRLAAVPSESVLPPPRDPVSLGEPSDQPPKSDTVPPATALVRSYPQLVEKLAPPTSVDDGKLSSPFENLPIRESQLLAQQSRAAWRDGLLLYALEIRSSLANTENNTKNEWLEPGVGETIGVIEHPGKEGPQLDKKRDGEPEMEWAHEKPEEGEGEQAAAQIEGQAEHLSDDSRPHCAGDGSSRIDRPSEGNNAHGGASNDSFEAEEQPRAAI